MAFRTVNICTMEKIKEKVIKKDFNFALRTLLETGTVVSRAISPITQGIRIDIEATQERD